MEGTAAGVTSSTLSRSSTVEEGDFLEGAEAKLKLIQKSSKAAVWRTKFALLGLSLFFFFCATPMMMTQFGMLPPIYALFGIFQPASIFCGILAVQPTDTYLVRGALIMFSIVGFGCGPLICLPSAFAKLGGPECANTSFAPESTATSSPLGAPVDYSLSADPDGFCAASFLFWALQLPMCLTLGVLVWPALRKTGWCCTGEWRMTTYAKQFGAIPRNSAQLSDGPPALPTGTPRTRASSGRCSG